MSGTKAGGIKARNSNLAKHGPDFYRKIGQKGGRNGHTGGFAANRALARVAGSKGGRKSRRRSTAPLDDATKAKIKYLNLDLCMSCAAIAQEVGVSAYFVRKCLQEK